MLYKNAHIVKYEQISDKLNILIENTCDEIYYEDFLVQVLVLKKTKNISSTQLQSRTWITQNISKRR